MCREATPADAVSVYPKAITETIHRTPQKDMRTLPPRKFRKHEPPPADEPNNDKKQAQQTQQTPKHDTDLRRTATANVDLEKRRRRKSWRWAPRAATVHTRHCASGNVRRYQTKGI